MDGETVGLKATERDLEKGEEHNTGECNVVFVDGSKGDCENLTNKDIKNFHLDKTESYCGLKKEDLLKYAKDPYWVKLRIILLIVFGAVWLAMLVTAIVIIVVTPKCPPRPNQEWWETAMVYCIQPKSFLDSNGDGVGDLGGIHSKLEYVKDILKADAINLGIIQQSTHETNLGTDVSNFTAVDPKYGSLKDFEDLRTAIHKKGMKLILDFVPNHSSKKHPWFEASKFKVKEFKDFYIWHPGRNTTSGFVVPNDLKNAYGQPAWTLDKNRNEYYYHSYSTHEPDLNLTNSDVIAKLDKAILYWLSLKVDGIRILGTSHLVEKTPFSDYIRDNDPASRLDTFNLINHWRQLLDNQTNLEMQRSQPQIRILLAETDGDPNNVSYLFGQKGSEDTTLGPHLPINKQLLKLDHHCKASCLSDLIHGWFDSIGKTSRHSNWMVSDQNSSRIASRLRENDFINVVYLLLHTLPGATFVYYGDEIGMHDTRMTANNSNSSNEIQVSFGPMQWKDQLNAGFSQGDPWIPTSSNYSETNVESQLARGFETSKLRVFAKLASLRKEPSIQSGQFKASLSKNIYYYLRQAEGHPAILVALNLGPTSSTLAIRKGNLEDDIPSAKATILASTYNFNGRRADAFFDGAEVDLDSAIFLHPGEGVVLKWLEERSIF